MKHTPGRIADASAKQASPPADPLWYKDAVFYEIRVGAFQDGDGDGTGDG